MSRRRRRPAPQNTPRTERPCAMPNCRRTTARPFGYCDHCWDPTRTIPSA